MRVVDLGGYRQQVDGEREYRFRHRDTPKDARELMALARDIEWEDKIILDRSHNDD